MSAYLVYKLWKLGLFFVGAIIYGFITGRRKRRQGQPHPEAED